MRNRKSRRKLPSEPVTLIIEKLSHEGRGISHHEGKVVFVDQALTGEQVDVRFTNMKGSFAEGVAVAVHNKSALRVEPQCPHFDICGGCSLQHMDSAAQLQFKSEVLHEKLEHSTDGSSYRHLDVISGPVAGYRRKARLAVRYVAKKQRALVGFRERHNNFIADIQTCSVLDPRVSTLLPAMQELVTRLDSFEQIPQIEVAAGDINTDGPDLALIFRHLSALSDSDTEQLRAFAEQHHLALYLQPKGPTTVHKLYPPELPERLYYEHADFGLSMAFHPLDFTQVNAFVNRQMINKALELLAPQKTERVLDLFCGLGNFTLPLATLAGSVVGVEVVEMMVQRGNENAQRNNLTNVEFICADLTLPPSEHAWLQAGFDKVLLDPPRSGAIEVLPAVVAAKPERIVYVSCNPSTLARDAEYLGTVGYKLEAAGAMDMFPHTSHVEALAVFVPSTKRNQ